MSKKLTFSAVVSNLLLSCKKRGKKTLLPLGSVSVASRTIVCVALMLFTLGVGNAWAQTTINASDVSGWNGTRGEQSGSASGFTITTTDGIYSTQLRTYASATFGISAPSGTNLKKIVFTYSQGGFTNPSAGSISSGTWEGDVNSLTFTETSQVRVTKMVITTASGCSTKLTITKAGQTNGSSKRT